MTVTAIEFLGRRGQPVDVASPPMSTVMILQDFRPDRLRPWSSSRRDSGKARRSRRFALRPEFLEERITPSGNIAITGASVVDSSDHALSTINAGQSVDIQLNFTTQNLPSGASYYAGITVNGLTLNTTNVTFGAGSSGSGSWYIYWGGYTATSGVNQVSVTIDPNHSVAETSFADNTTTFTFNAGPPLRAGISYTVAQIRSTYGLNSLPNFGSSVADGTGQTIAIVDAGNDPTIVTDLDGFDQAMSLTTQSTETLYQQYGPSANILSVYNQSGANITANIGTSGSNGVPPDVGWDGEITLDVEWAHAIAPGAKIDLIETNGDTGPGERANLFTGDKVAAALPGVSAVSDSWAFEEWSGEAAYDTSTLVTPANHTGVTFLAASGDNGEYGEYPAYSPNVVAVGGTQLIVNNDGYGSEVGWSFPIPRTLDDGSSSYSQAGTWTSKSGGFSGTYGTASGGSSASATWTTPITSTDQGWVGGTELSATWTAAASNATDATYTIYDGTQASGTVLGTVAVDQTKAPAGTLDGSSQFQELGDYFPSSGTLTVVLNAGTANGTVVADAIGVAPGWASSGGQSKYEAEPSYQLPFQSTGFRTNPDVSFDGSLNSGVDCYQAGSLGYDYFGTSLACPCWAGLIAIANQGRVAAGGTTFNGVADPTQTLQALYSLPSADYHDVTAGYNGTFASSGYDEVTGRGTPVANLVVPDLVGYQLASRLVVSAQPPASLTAGTSFGLTVAVEDSLGDTITGYVGSVSIALASGTGTSGSLGGTLTATVINGVATFGGLTLDVVGSGYRIVASSGLLTVATTNAFNVVNAPASTYTLTPMPGTGSVIAGVTFPARLTAYDPYGNVASNYLGTVHFTSGDAGFVAPADDTFTPSDAGSHVFQLLLATPGSQTVTVTDTASPSLTATSTIAVSPPTATTTTLQASPGGPVFGQAVTLTATVGPNPGNGQVSFFDGSKLLGTVALTPAGASLTLANLDVGPHLFSASYGGSTDHSFAPSTSSTSAYQVGLDSTTSTLVSSTGSSSPGRAITLTATIRVVAPGAGLPTGLVTFFDGGIALGSASINGSGLASLVVSTLTRGTHAITASYAGDPDDSGSTAAAIPVRVGDEVPGDFYGTGQTDLAVYLPVQGAFAIRNPVTGVDSIIPFGSPGAGNSIPAVGDYDGSGQAELAVYLPKLGAFAYRPAKGGPDVIVYFGIPGVGLDIPAPGDYDGSGHTEFAVYLPTLGAFAYRPADGGPDKLTYFGTPGAGNSIPAPGDYDGSGHTELAVYLPAIGAFAYRPADGGPDVLIPFGSPGAGNSIPAPGDYDGSGHTELAVYLPKLGAFAYRPADGGPDVIVYFGIPGVGLDTPAPGDYDGSGQTEFAVYLPTLGAFAFRPAKGGKDQLIFFGSPGEGLDIPTTSLDVP